MGMCAYTNDHSVPGCVLTDYYTSDQTSFFVYLFALCSGQQQCATKLCLSLHNKMFTILFPFFSKGANGHTILVHTH